MITGLTIDEQKPVYAILERRSWLEEQHWSAMRLWAAIKKADPSDATPMPTESEELKALKADAHITEIKYT